jgi:hypothetical protein
VNGNQLNKDIIMKRDINENDKILSTEILKSFGIMTESCDVVWSSLFIVTDDYSISLSILNDINERIIENTDFRLFGVNRDKSSDNLTIHLAFKDIK